MSYEVIVRFSPVSKARLAEVVLHTSGVREDGPDRWVFDVWAAGGSRFFSVDVLERSWLGKPRALRSSLPFGGGVDEARAFGGALQALALRLGAEASDAAGALTRGGEAEDALARWRAANLRALATWELGFRVRPGNATGCGRTACPEVAPEEDGPLAVASLVNAYLRAEALDEARAVASRAIDRLGATFELGALLATVEARRADPTGARERAQALVATLTRGERDEDEQSDEDEDEARSEAADALVALGAHAVSPLVDALTRGGDAEGHASDTLLRLGATAVPALLEAFSRTSGDARLAVELLLMELREPALAHAASRVRAGAGRDEVADLVDLLRVLVPGAEAAEAVAERLVSEPGVPGVELEGFLRAALDADPAVLGSVLRLLREGGPDEVQHAARAASSAWSREAVDVLVDRLLRPPTAGVDVRALADEAADLDRDATVRALEQARAGADELLQRRALEALDWLGELAEEPA